MPARTPQTYPSDSLCNRIQIAKQRCNFSGRNRIGAEQKLSKRWRLLDNSVNGSKSVGQCGRSGLQYQGGFYLVNGAATNGRHAFKSRPGCDPLGAKLLPHQEPMMMSGARRTTSSAMTILSFADLHRESSANMSLPPAISMSSETQAIPEIIGLSHSSNIPSVCGSVALPVAVYPQAPLPMNPPACWRDRGHRPAHPAYESYQKFRRWFAD